MRAARRWLIIGAVNRLLPALLLSLLATAVLAGPAAAAQVAYVDGGQIWVSTLDGTQKRSLSGPSPDAKQWTEVAQADSGAILGVRREPGKQGYLNATTLWGPDGAVAGHGALTGKPGWSVNAYPVTLDLTPDGGTVVYGYSNSRVGSGGFEAVFGTYAEGSTNWYIEPFDVAGMKSGTLAGSRLVAWSGSTVYLQKAVGQPPYSNEADPWFGVTGVWRVDVAATGTVVAVELEGGQVAMVPFAGLGAPPPSDGSDCMLPTAGAASDVSISQDGGSMAWRDGRGVVVAGTPVWFPSPDVTTCNLSRPPVVISATGKMPSIGNSSAATPPVVPATPKESGNGSGPRLVKPPKTLKAAALKAGVVLKVKVAGAGKVSATGKVGAKLVASGKARAKKAGIVRVKLKATRAYRGKLGTLVGKKLRIKISAAGETTTLTRRLG